MQLAIHISYLIGESLLPDPNLDRTLALGDVIVLFHHYEGASDAEVSIDNLAHSLLSLIQLAVSSLGFTLSTSAKTTSPRNIDSNRTLQ